MDKGLKTSVIKRMEKSRVAVLVRIRPTLKARLVDLAKSEHRSLNQQIEFLLERSISRETQNLSKEDPPGKTELNRKR
jgi:hypothetical protein